MSDPKISAITRLRRNAFALLLGCLTLGAAAQAPTGGAGAVQTAAAPAAACPAILKHQFKRLQDDAPQDLCQYAGKVILVVNTASYCGFAGQFEGLESLYARLAPKGLVVLGFPSNDFGKQEPGESKETADFCFNTYGVKFPMFAKTAVVGKEANPLYVALAKASGRAPKWNFHKYLIDRKGRVVDNYLSLTGPDSPMLVGQIQQALDAR
ncbi:MAG: glutathione peroxidase [Betaproteobacteria bacterium]|jgi:glutathione peroxidase|nr:glutathione peroxidase [Betaproteobacteria bacterium]